MARVNSSPSTLSPRERHAQDARIGRAIEDLDTPTLLLDRAASDRNLARMVGFCRGRPGKLRPHFKNHKCVFLTQRQLQAGAVGMTCANLNEAEVLVDNGICDVLIANQVVGSAKVELLVQLVKHARISVAVDHTDQVEAISRASVAAEAVVRLLIEVDIGMGRCGLSSSEAVLELARKLQGIRGVEFGGLQAYEGHFVNVVDREQRRIQSRAAMGLVVDTRQLIERSGIPVSCISGCSSATYDSTGI